VPQRLRESICRLLLRFSDGDFSQAPFSSTVATASATGAPGAPAGQSGCLVNRYNSIECGGGESDTLMTATLVTVPVPRETHRVKFAEERNEYLTSSDPETDYGCFGGTDDDVDGAELAESGDGRRLTAGSRRRDGGGNATGNDWSSGDRGATATAHRPIIKHPQAARPRR
jgi:hypothetical protein